MGQQLSQLISTNQNNINTKKSIECLQDTNFECPDSLTLELYEISIGSGDARRMSNTWRIKEFYIPQYNIGINQEYYGSRSYNLIINAFNRYHKDESNSKNSITYGEPAKFIKSFTLNKDTNKEEIEEIFNVIKCCIISQNAESSITKLFELAK
jgi:hypothetical protein